MYRITGFVSLDLSDPIPHRFDRCLGIQLGDIVSPRCLLTESDISAWLSLSNAIGIQVTLGWFTFESFKGPVALFDGIFANVRKPWFIETFWYCRSLLSSAMSMGRCLSNYQRAGSMGRCLSNYQLTGPKGRCLSNYQHRGSIGNVYRIPTHTLNG